MVLTPDAMARCCCCNPQCLSINLYEFIKNNNFQGLSLGLIRRFAIQLLASLRYLKKHRIIHCDLKPGAVPPALWGDHWVFANMKTQTQGTHATPS